MLLNTLPGNSTHKEHQLLFPLATCFPSLASVHGLFPCQGCAVQNTLIVPFFFVAVLSFPMWDVKPTQDYFAPWKTLDTWYHRNEQKFWAELLCRSTSARKCFPLLISKVYSSFWPWVITSLLGCNRNRSAPSPRGVQLLNVPIADTFYGPKGHQLWRAVQMPTTAQHPVSTQPGRLCSASQALGGSKMLTRSLCLKGLEIFRGPGFAAWFSIDRLIETSQISPKASH